MLAALIKRKSQYLGNEPLGFIVAQSPAMTLPSPVNTAPEKDRLTPAHR